MIRGTILCTGRRISETAANAGPIDSDKQSEGDARSRSLGKNIDRLLYRNNVSIETKQESLPRNGGRPDRAFLKQCDAAACTPSFGQNAEGRSTSRPIRRLLESPGHRPQTAPGRTALWWLIRRTWRGSTPHTLDSSVLYNMTRTARHRDLQGRMEPRVEVNEWVFPPSIVRLSKELKP
jgi:hypothetical protein